MDKFKKLSFPYLVWMIILTGIPLIVMLLISFMDISYLQFNTATISVDHFSKVFNATYAKAFWLSIKLGLLATLGSLIIGYPIAYIVSTSKFKNKFLFLLIFLIPMWTNLLLRVETINRILQPEGFMKNVFNISLDLSGTESAVVIAMIIIYLPFMIFPIYTVLEKMDKSLIEASMDLGANDISTFFKVTLPLSLKGITSGITMVFLPCAMGFTIPYIISNGNIQLIGNIIEKNFKGTTGSYNVGSLASLVVIIFVFGALFLISKIDEDGETLL
ncbi:MAG: ABC transporter permease [Erysipelotrichaceae bacterium]